MTQRVRECCCGDMFKQTSASHHNEGTQTEKNKGICNNVLKVFFCYLSNHFCACVSASIIQWNFGKISLENKVHCTHRSPFQPKQLSVNLLDRLEPFCKIFVKLQVVWIFLLDSYWILSVKMNWTAVNVTTLLVHLIISLFSITYTEKNDLEKS